MADEAKKDESRSLVSLDGSTNSLINLNVGDLGGPIGKIVTLLIEKISSAFGAVYEPFHVVNLAKAEVEVELIRARGQLDVAEVQRAFGRFAAEEVRKQQNIESITRLAIPDLREDAKPEKIEDDWVANFFDKCRNVSAPEMQKLWAGILARQANSPNSFSRRTINLLSDLDREEAELFTNLCGFSWMIGGGPLTPLVFNAGKHYPIYAQSGITFRSLLQLDSLGLIRFDDIAGFSKTGFDHVAIVTYLDGTPMFLSFKKPTGNKLSVGRVMLTKAGIELSGVCKPRPVPGFIEFACERWREEGLEVRTLVEYGLEMESQARQERQAQAAKDGAFNQSAVPNGTSDKAE